MTFKVLKVSGNSRWSFSLHFETSSNFYWFNHQTRDLANIANTTKVHTPAITATQDSRTADMVYWHR